MMKSIDQQMFDALFIRAEKALDGVADVYDTLPDLSAEYPFVVLGEIQVTPRQLKYITMGKMFVTIYVWGNSNDRRLVAGISETLLEDFSRAMKLDTRKVKMIVSNSSKRILEDTSLGSGNDKHTLWHGILTCEFEILI